MTQAVPVFIGLGSNLNDPVAQVSRALEALAALAVDGQVAASPLYASDPVGVTDQPPFINAVAGFSTSLAPEALLERLLAIELAHHRVRIQRWGPRTLDLDLLVYGDRVVELATLSVPHPRLHERAFVLYPLADLAPTLEIPGQGRLSALLARCPPDGIRRLTDHT